MSDRVTGTAAAALGAHSKDAMESAGASERHPPDRAAIGHAGPSPSAGEAVRYLADDALGRARETGAAATRATRTAAEEAYARSAAASRYAGRVVRSDPLLALLAAGGIGFALGLLLGGRR